MFVQCIGLIAFMHTAQLRQADLDFLVVFAVVAEERNIAQAAARLRLSRPAMSRDDLLLRNRGSFELTLLGQRLLREFKTMLPRLDRLLSGTGMERPSLAFAFEAY